MNNKMIKCSICNYYNFADYRRFIDLDFGDRRAVFDEYKNLCQCTIDTNGYIHDHFDACPNCKLYVFDKKEFEIMKAKFQQRRRFPIFDKYFHAESICNNNHKKNEIASMVEEHMIHCKCNGYYFANDIKKQEFMHKFNYVDAEDILYNDIESANINICYNSGKC